MPYSKSGFYTAWRTVNITFPTQSGAAHYAASLKGSTGKETRVEKRRDGQYKVLIKD